jgi:hypothetical protein
MDKSMEKILIVAEDLEYDRTSCGLLNTKMLYVLAHRFETHLLVEGKFGDPLREIGLASYHQFHLQKLWYWKWLGKIPLARSIPEWLTGINHASYHKYQQWKKKLQVSLANESYDVVLFLGSGMGWYAHMAYSSMKPYKGVVGISLHDPFPMALLPAPYNATMNHGQRMLIKRMNALINKVQGCYAPSLRLVEHLNPSYPGLAGKSSVVHHLAFQLPFLLQTQSETKTISEIEGLDSSKHFFLVHMGTLLEGRSPGHFFKAILRFLHANTDAAGVTKVLFIGNAHPKLLADFALVSGHPNFVIHTNLRISYAHALRLQKSASANLIIESDRYHSPQLFGKFADSVLVDKPIVCLGPETSEARRILGQDYPYQATNGQEEEIYSMLERLYQSWKMNPVQTLNRPDLQHDFNPQRLIDVVENWLNK